MKTGPSAPNRDCYMLARPRSQKKVSTRTEQQLIFTRWSIISRPEPFVPRQEPRNIILRHEIIYHEFRVHAARPQNQHSSTVLRFSSCFFRNRRTSTSFSRHLCRSSSSNIKLSDIRRRAYKFYSRLHSYNVVLLTLFLHNTPRRGRTTYTRSIYTIIHHLHHW